jgi:hypothetical protein
LFASAAKALMPVMVERSPVRQWAAEGQAARASWAREALRAWRVTWWDRDERSLAVRRPRPSLEPVMRMRILVCEMSVSEGGGWCVNDMR